MTDPGFSLSIPAVVPVSICAVVIVWIICRTILELKDRS